MVWPVSLSGTDALMVFIQETGPWFWLVLGCTVMAWTCTVALFVAQTLKVRVPLFLWAGLPALSVLAGQIGTLLGQQQLQEALMWAESGVKSLTWAGHQVALNSDIVGHYAGAAGLLASLWALGIAQVAVPGPEPRWTLGLGFTALLLPLMAGCAAGAFSIGSGAWGAPVVLLLGAPALALGCLRGSDEARCHTARVGLATMLTLATLWAAVGDELRAQKQLAEVWISSWLETMEVLEELVTAAQHASSAAILGGGVSVLAASSLMLLTGAMGRLGLDARAFVGAVVMMGLFISPLLTEALIRLVAWQYLPVY